MRVCLGGTFYPLHKGHRKLIMTACRFAGPEGIVVVGVTEGEVIAHKQNIVPVDERIVKLKKVFDQFHCKRVDFVVITDRFGPAIVDFFDIIVVSRDTVESAVQINDIRREKGLSVLDIVVVDIVLADDGAPICSSRIRVGEIDLDGHVLK